MHTRAAGLAFIFFLSAESLFCQEPDFNGFIRAGAYAGKNPRNDKPNVSSAFTDVFLRTEYDNGEKFKAFAELQYRYGTEFNETVSDLNLREGYVTYLGRSWNVSAGQKIIKWGRADFTNPTSKLTPRNFLLRSPDREEISMGNLLAELNVFLSERVRLQAVAIPLYRSSVLSIDPIPLPSYINIRLIDSFKTDDSFSYGLRADFYMKGIDVGISWFDGPDPMPGIALTRFEIQNTGGFPLPAIDLAAKPFRNRMAGIDFETNTGAFGFRGEAAWSFPELNYKSYEYVPLPSVEIVAGTDWSKGNWRLYAEYYGKYMYDYTSPDADPLIGTEFDLDELTQLFGSPAFDPEDYVRNQVGAFNRLYNYQIERLYHSAVLRAESEFAYGRIIPSVLAMYNFTSGDLLLVPEIRYKPAGGLTIVAGAEYYKGRPGSLYRIIDDFMNGIYVALRADF